MTNAASTQSTHCQHLMGAVAFRERETLRPPPATMRSPGVRSTPACLEVADRIGFLLQLARETGRTERDLACARAELSDALVEVSRLRLVMLEACGRLALLPSQVDDASIADVLNDVAELLDKGRHPETAL